MRDIAQTDALAARQTAGYVAIAAVEPPPIAVAAPNGDLFIANLTSLADLFLMFRKGLA